MSLRRRPRRTVGRSLGFYGGETPIATRPRARELRDALPLVVAAIGMALFFPLSTGPV